MQHCNTFSLRCNCTERNIQNIVIVYSTINTVTICNTATHFHYAATVQREIYKI